MIRLYEVTDSSLREIELSLVDSSGWPAPPWELGGGAIPGPEGRRVKRISLLLPATSNLPLFIAYDPSSSKHLHLTLSIHFPSLPCKGPLPKHGLAHHAFAPPRPRACSRH